VLLDNTALSSAMPSRNKFQVLVIAALAARLTHDPGAGLWSRIMPSHQRTIAHSPMKRIELLC